MSPFSNVSWIGNACQRRSVEFFYSPACVQKWYSLRVLKRDIIALFDQCSLSFVPDSMIAVGLLETDCLPSLFPVGELEGLGIVSAGLCTFVKVGLGLSHAVSTFAPLSFSCPLQVASGEVDFWIDSDPEPLNFGTEGITITSSRRHPRSQTILPLIPPPLPNSCQYL